MADIKLFVCCHQPMGVPEHPLLVPIQVGAALSDTHFPRFLYDDTGDNISTKNRSYCELTAQYWAWKNVEADYYGFFHYRRYLYPDQTTECLYRIADRPTQTLLDDLGYGRFAEVIQQYDLIVPKGENMYVPVWQYYADAPFHHEKDLALIKRIVLERTPKMSSPMEEYLSGTVQYFGNIFIMQRNVFFNYCSWLFPILEEFDRLADLSGYGQEEQRVDGYLAERLLGVYVTNAWKQGEKKILELPRVHFYHGVTGVWRSILNGILPPGSERRMLAKKILGVTR